MAFYTIERRVSRRIPFGYGLGVTTVMPLSPTPTLVDAGVTMRNLVHKVDAPAPIDPSGAPILVPGVSDPRCFRIPAPPGCPGAGGYTPSPVLPTTTEELVRRCSWLCPVAGVAGFFAGALLLRVLRG